MVSVGTGRHGRYRLVEYHHQSRIAYQTDGLIKYIWKISNYLLDMLSEIYQESVKQDPLTFNIITFIQLTPYVVFDLESYQRCHSLFEWQQFFRKI